MAAQFIYDDNGYVAISSICNNIEQNLPYQILMTEIKHGLPLQHDSRNGKNKTQSISATIKSRNAA